MRLFSRMGSNQGAIVDKIAKYIDIIDKSSLTFNFIFIHHYYQNLIVFSFIYSTLYMPKNNTFY